MTISQLILISILDILILLEPEKSVKNISIIQ